VARKVGGVAEVLKSLGKLPLPPLGKRGRTYGKKYF